MAIALYKRKGGCMLHYLVTAMLIMVYPGEIMVNGPDGAVCIVLQENDNYVADQGQISINDVLIAVDLRLRLLDEACREYSQPKYDCGRIIREIQFLLNLLPAHFHFTIDPSLYRNGLNIQAGYPMSAGDFAVLIRDLDEEPFSDNKLNLLEIAAASHFLLVEQVEVILEYFVFEDDRIEAVRILHPQILDDENSYRLFNKFVFSNSKQEVAKIIN
jgi:hypothetical protein